MTTPSEAIKATLDEAGQICLREFRDLIATIEKAPDAQARLDRVKIILADLADEDIAARELANAFATIEQYADYLPADVYNSFADWSANFLSYARWDSDPELMRAAGPHLVRAAVKKKKETHA